MSDLKKKEYSVDQSMHEKESLVQDLEDDRQDVREAFQQAKSRIHLLYGRSDPFYDVKSEHKHPDPLVESQSLSCVQPPDLTKRLVLVDILSKKLSDPQLEAVHHMEETFQQDYDKKGESTCWR